MEVFVDKDNGPGFPAYVINTSLRCTIYAIAIKIFKAVAYSLMIL
jgi:hypothetical protein